jgi:hypothetical protein
LAAAAETFVALRSHLLPGRVPQSEGRLNDQHTN